MTTAAPRRQHRYRLGFQQVRPYVGDMCACGAVMRNLKGRGKILGALPILQDLDPTRFLEIRSKEQHDAPNPDPQDDGGSVGRQVTYARLLLSLFGRKIPNGIQELLVDAIIRGKGPHFAPVAGEKPSIGGRERRGRPPAQA